MVNYFVFGKIPAYIAFHNEPVLHHISISRCIWMIWYINFYVSICSFFFMSSKLVIIPLSLSAICERNSFLL